MVKVNDAFLKHPRCGMVVYAFGAALSFFYEPIGLLTIAWVFWFYREKLIAVIHKDTQWVKNFPAHDYNWFAWLPIYCVAGYLLLFTGGIITLDDFSRHATAYLHNFNYSHYYLYENTLSSLNGSPWFGFEWVLGKLHLFFDYLMTTFFSGIDEIGKNKAALFLVYHFVELTLLYTIGWIFIPIFRFFLKEHPIKNIMTGCLIALMLGVGIGVRGLTARPEFFLMLAMFSVWRLPPRMWIILMMLMQPLYWLSWIYSIGAILIEKWSMVKRISAMCLVLLAYGVSWATYQGIDFVFHFYQITQHALTHRIIHAAENASFMSYYFSVFGLVVSSVWVLILMRTQRNKWFMRDNYAVLIMMVIWLLLNQMRYVIYLVPCLFYLYAKTYMLPENIIVIKDSFDKRIMARKGLLILGVFSLFVVNDLPIRKNAFFQRLPAFYTLPVHAKVLTFFDTSTFLLPALIPSIRVAPPMEVGFAQMDLQKFLQERLHTPQSFNCERFKKQFPLFTHIVEDGMNRRLPTVTPSCLRLQEGRGGWYLWQIL